MLRRLSALLTGVVLVAGLSGPVRADPVPTALGIGAAAIVATNFIFDMPEPDKGRDFIAGGIGYFDPIDQDNTSAEFRFEYWARWTWLKTRPIAGVFATTDKGIGAYIGIRHDLYLTDNLVISIETAPTLFSVGDGNHLGSYAVLRSGVAVAYRFDNASRLSLTLHHMSHGEVFSNRNPGVETAAITFALPIDSLFGGR